MPTSREIESIIKNKNKRLQKLKEQQALNGRSTSPETLIEIEEIEQDLEKLSRDIKNIKISPAPTANIPDPSTGRVNNSISILGRPFFIIPGLGILLGVVAIAYFITGPQPRPASKDIQVPPIVLTRHEYEKDIEGPAPGGTALFHNLTENDVRISLNDHIMYISPGKVSSGWANQGANRLKVEQLYDPNQPYTAFDKIEIITSATVILIE